MESTIEVNGKKYDINTLSAEVQAMVGMHQKWNSELVTLHERVYQLQLALESLGNNIVTEVTNHGQEANAVTTQMG